MDKELFDRGLEIRKQVLGREMVERVMATADDFVMSIHELNTEWCWGYLWDRPGMSRRDRSLLNLGIISALNRPGELKTQVKAALTNGVTPEEIREALLQVAVYVGVPAGVDSFRVAREAFAEVDAAK